MISKIVHILKDQFMARFPEGKIKNRLICLYFNSMNEVPFHVSYFSADGYFLISLAENINIKFYDIEAISFFTILYDGYLRHYKIRKGDIIIDGGAYLGEFAIYASIKTGDNGKVIAFEPDPLNFNKLQSNIKLNNLSNIIPIQKGIWGCNKSLKFICNSSNSSSINLYKNNINNIYELPVIKLDDEISRLGIKQIDFIKMDIEGAEIEAIKGCFEILNKNNTNLAIASYHIVDGQPTCIPLERLFATMGYDAITEFPRHLTTYANKRENSSDDNAIRKNI